MSMAPISIDFHLNGNPCEIVLRDFRTESKDAVVLVSYLYETRTKVLTISDVELNGKKVSMWFRARDNRIEAHVPYAEDSLPSGEFLSKLHDLAETVLGQILSPYFEVLDRMKCLRNSGLLKCLD